MINSDLAVPRAVTHRPIATEECLCLGEIALRQGNRASDQFVVLLLALHSSGCGGNSPARVLGPALARQLWDTWVIGTQRKVSVVAAANRGTEGGGWTIVIRFGVSLALMGITTDVSVTCSDSVWVGEDLCVRHEGRGSPLCALTNTKSGRIRKLEAEQKDFMRCLCMNGMWWLQIRKEGNLLVVTNLQTCGDGDHQVLVPIPECFIVQFMSFNKMSLSQALMLMAGAMEQQLNTMLVVVDVEGTYTTKTLQIVSSTQCEFPRHYFRDSGVKSLLLLKNKSGQNVFIVETIPCDLCKPPSAAFIIQATGETRKVFCDSNYRGTFHQHSGSLFSYYHTGHMRLEIWDCNDTESFNQKAPLITIQVDGKQNFGVLSGGGLIFAIEDSTRLKVLEAKSGHIISRLDFLKPGWILQNLDGGWARLYKQSD
ncbi:hypothetical protein Pelo_16109 [Pelomyxa schiedti]|nr:hypothetical protein Pelo_16109 [Pelomyxa schiedti]